MSENKATKQIIILLGPPGSGKGTQATLLAEKLDLYYFETSNIIETAIRNHRADEYVEVDGQKYSFGHEKELWEKGILCSPPFVVFLVEEKINELFQSDKGIIFAGSPRTMHEGEKIVPQIEALYGKENIKVILLELSPEQTVFRNSNRKICELMRHPVLYAEETKNLEHCPLDGSKLLKRAGLDDAETIKIRIGEYEERTFPLVEFFKKAGLVVKRVNGEQSVEAVYKDILKAL
ncbi:MAG: nucleoside monophosphate kinase [Candidatus Portnoybacteria bacterium]|nr:nucleoside monophosphate kinase [Candidatus Portnoybacteria bacterium]